MNTRRVQWLAVLAVLAAVLGPLAERDVDAQVVRCSENSQGQYTCVVIAARISPNVSRPIGGPSGPPLVWTRTLISDSIGAPPSCERTVSTLAGPVQEFGRPWLVVVRNNETGDIVMIRLECQWSGETPPEPPPPAPPIETIVSDVDIGSAFSLETGVSPPVERRGVSQLPTWLWCSNAAPIDVVAEVRPYRASARATVTGVVWTINGPDGVVEKTASQCGSEPPIDSDGGAAATTWTPNEPGVSTIALTTTWSAQWTYTYFDPVLGPVNLGTFDLGSIERNSEPFTYDVYEIQTVGVANP